MSNTRNKRNKVKVDVDDEKLRTSIWFLTLNSNRELDDEDKAEFRRRALEMFQIFDQYVVPNEHATPDPEMKIKIKPHFETGEKRHRYHCHASIICDHNSNVRIAVEAIRSDYKEDGWYLHVNSMRSVNELNRMAAYARKNQ
jgi:hypothetical protein